MLPSTSFSTCVGFLFCLRVEGTVDDFLITYSLSKMGKCSTEMVMRTFLCGSEKYFLHFSYDAIISLCDATHPKYEEIKD